jgi:uncharacterized protein YcbK (DUF882 family)
LIDKRCKANQVDQRRRFFLKFCAVSVLANSFPRFSLGAEHKYLPQRRALSFFNSHTEESLKTIYCEHGRYLPVSLDGVNYILRDHRTGEVKPIDPRILDLLFRIRMKIKTQDSFHIISGYRSPKTNALLRKNGRGVAKRSFHMLGKAVDVRLPNVSVSFLRDIAAELGGGGVGYYPRSNFIHLDLGPIRYWNGKA